MAMRFEGAAQYDEEVQETQKVCPSFCQVSKLGESVSVSTSSAFVEMFSQLSFGGTASSKEESFQALE